MSAPNSHRDNQAEAWLAVCDALNRVAPGWSLRADRVGLTGMQMAVAQIEELAEQPNGPEGGRKMAYATPEAYAAVNPMGGPAVIFEAMAKRIRAGEDFYAVLDDYGLQSKPEAGAER